MHVQKEQIIKWVRKSNEHDKYEQIIRQTGTKVKWARQIRTNNKTSTKVHWVRQNNPVMIKLLEKNDAYCCRVNIYSCITDKDDASMSYLRYLCYLRLYAYSSVQNILCCVFAVLFFVFCTLCYFSWLSFFDYPFSIL
jgi:hypothetical protein